MSPINHPDGGAMSLSGGHGLEGSQPACGMRQMVNVGEGERFASLAAGSALLLMGLFGPRRSRPLSFLAGAGLLYRGLTGHCYMYQALGVSTARRSAATAVPAQQGFKFEYEMDVQRPPAELYRFWRSVENLPRVMSHLKSVTALDDKRSHWVAEGPMNSRVEWDAEIYRERENEMIAWRSLPGGDVETAGSIHFEPLADGTSTRLKVSLKYNPPAGKVGATLARFLGTGAEQQIADDLQRFKSAMESGEYKLHAAIPQASSDIVQPS